jgi:hypothetical protein
VDGTGEQLELATLERTAILNMFDRPELETQAQEVEAALREIMKQATGP